jgi:Ca-activated chloride channel family protein
MLYRRRQIVEEGSHMRCRVWIAVCCLCVAGAARAADSDSPRVTLVPRPVRVRDTAPAAIRVNTNLVLIPVTVTDPNGAPFPGLTREAFRLFENGVEQKVKYFASEDAPVSLGVVFDSSRSMEGKLDRSRAAVGRLFRTAIPGDEFFLVEFNDAPRLLCDFTGDTEVIEKSLVGIAPRNWTALLDAVYMAIQQMKHARNARKALLILSDGGDNNSRYTETEMKNLVREADVSIYSIGLFGGGLIRRHVRLLEQLSAETGGRLWQVDKLSDLPDTIEQISAAIRHQYLLGFSPQDSSDNGLYRKVQVKLSPPPDDPPLRASWRTGYYAPLGR